MLNNYKGMIILTIATLFSPIIWLQMGPKGHFLYGENAPDVYILGCYISGKDTSWGGINFAIKFQLIFVSLFLVSNIWAIVNLKRNKSVKNQNLINTALLFLFPFWLTIYTNGVINNSDAADLSIYPHIGLIFYLIIIALQLKIIDTLKKTAN